MMLRTEINTRDQRCVTSGRRKTEYKPTICFNWRIRTRAAGVGKLLIFFIFQFQTDSGSSAASVSVVLTPFLIPCPFNQDTDMKSLKGFQSVKLQSCFLKRKG